MTIALSEIEIAWLAGLLEGEGSFGLDATVQCFYGTSVSFLKDLNDRPRHYRARKQACQQELLLS